jgi:hypothetical protein
MGGLYQLRLILDVSRQTTHLRTFVLDTKKTPALCRADTEAVED